MNVDRRRGWDGTRAGFGFEQRIERRRWRRRRWRWRWLPGLSTLARFMARRTTTSTRSPPFPLRHITRQTDALPTTVRENGSTQGVHLTALFYEARLRIPKTRASHFGSTCPLSSIQRELEPRRPREELSMFLGVSPNRSICRWNSIKTDRSRTVSNERVIPHRILHRPGGFPIIGMMPCVAIV